MDRGNCTLFDILGLKDLSSIDYAALGLAPPTNKLEHTHVALKALQSYAGSNPADTIVRGHLLLGSAQYARQLDFLRAMKVTDVIVMANMRASIEGVYALRSEIRFWKVNVPDCLGVPIIAELRTAIHFIFNAIFPIAELPDLLLEDIGGNRAVKSPSGKVLFVHCQQGISRSTTLVILYLFVRLLLSLPENAQPDDIISPRTLAEKLQTLRQSSPNVSFLAQLTLIYEVTKSIMDCGIFREIADCRSRRRSQFDLALQYCECYVEVPKRCIAETLSYIRSHVLETLLRLSGEINRLGMRVLAIRNSSARDYTVWLREGLILENFVTYSQQEASFRSILTMHDRVDEDEMFARAVERVSLRWKGSQSAAADFLKLRTLNIQVVTDSVIDEQLELVPALSAASQGKICDESACPAFWDWLGSFRLPKGLVFQSGCGRERLDLIADGLKGRTLPGESMAIGLQWEEKLLPTVASAAQEAASQLNEILARFSCRNWAFWVIDKVALQCRVLGENLGHVHRSRVAAASRVPVVVTVSPPVVGQERSCVGAKKRRRRLRFEEVSEEELRKEIAVIEEKIRQAREQLRLTKKRLV